ncbi:cellobiose phosphotransferase system IIC component [compost metagenome]
MGTPVVVSGFIDGGWKVALFQVLLIILSYVIYYPFFKKIDNQEYKQETATAENAEVTA